MEKNKTNELQTLTLEQVCEILQVSRNTLLKYLKLGYIKAYRLPSKEWRFKANDIDAFLKKETNK